MVKLNFLKHLMPKPFDASEHKVATPTKKFVGNAPTNPTTQGLSNWGSEKKVAISIVENQTITWKKTKRQNFDNRQKDILDIATEILKQYIAKYPKLGLSMSKLEKVYDTWSIGTSYTEASDILQKSEKTGYSIKVCSVLYAVLNAANRTLSEEATQLPTQ